jgi:Spy/CpxP family protein refolding chaperone
MAAFVLLATATGLAQTQSSPPPPPQGPGGQGAPPAGVRGPLWQRAVHQLNLTPTQQQQIKAAIAQFRQAHPPGSGPDPSARKALREQVMQILTPAQREQVQAYMRQMRQQHPGAGGGEGESAPEPTPSP